MITKNKEVSELSSGELLGKLGTASSKKLSGTPAHRLLFLDHSADSDGIGGETNNNCWELELYGECSN